MAGVEKLSIDGSRGMVERHLPKAHTHPSIHPQEHCGWKSTDLPVGPGPGAFRELRWAEMPSAPQSRRSKDLGAFISGDASLVRRVLRMPWGKDTKEVTNRTTSSQDTHVPGQIALSNICC